MKSDYSANGFDLGTLPPEDSAKGSDLDTLLPEDAETELETQISPAPPPDILDVDLCVAFLM